ncbi:unnamed protein product [Anisakis simplex]|uniref:Piezo TM25-28 domain-containing protein n=1 Tax=Anisakis simplex TaxID=6269 RepID=A0A0M3K218_ANISI|nr:unnamed protein product [Anisakis simplex]
MIRRRKRLFGRFVLITFHRIIDITCALFFAASAVEHVSLLSIPQMVCAILLCLEEEEIPADTKHILCIAMGLYIPLINVTRLSSVVYNGVVTDLGTDDTQSSAKKWLYWTETFLPPEYAPYLALFNSGHLLKNPFDLPIFFYFLNVVLSMIQYKLSLILQSQNDKSYGGGSNDGVFERGIDNEPFKTNPIVNFYSQDARLFLDEVKQCVFSYYHWLVLLLLFSNGIRMSSPVFLSIGHIIFAFLNFWRGTDLYLSSLYVFRRKWRVITLYLLGTLLLQISANIARAILDEMVISKSNNQRIIAICRLLNVYFKKPGEGVVDPIGPYETIDVRPYSFDVIIFAALLLHLRMIVTW